MSQEGYKSSGHHGRLKIFVGAAPGVGKTYTMLRQARDLKVQGTDVVVGYFELHNRAETRALLADLEVVPRHMVEFHGRKFEELDLNAILARKPEVVVIDELAHTNVPGSRNAKRYMDVEELLRAGIDVMTAVNIQHFDSVRGEVEAITGVAVRETIPQPFIDKADELELIDVTPETIRRRLMDGLIYPPDRVQYALDHYFRYENLAGLRELALREVAEDVDQRLQESHDRRKIEGPVGALESVLVCANYLTRAEHLIRIGSLMAERLKADLLVLTVVDDEESAWRGKPEPLAVQDCRRLAEEYGARFVVEFLGDRAVGEVILGVAKTHNVTQIVIGQPRRGARLRRMVTGDPVSYLLRNLRFTDLRIVGWKERPRWTDPGDVAAVPDVDAVSPDPPSLEPKSGRLTIYIGLAPGVGKTYKMLQDAHVVRDKGVDVVIGWIETHGREETWAQVQDLEIIPPKTVGFENRDYPEMDVGAILARKPRVALVDELAHTNVPEPGANAKRYQDVLTLLDAGIDVVTTVNIQHLESLHDKVAHITGVSVRERIPDWFVDRARELKLVDVPPETLQERLTQGKIYAMSKVESALAHFFQLGNLSALRELALLEVADDVDQRLDAIREKPGGPKDKLLVCVNYRPHSEQLIRRGWRIADRLSAQLVVLIVMGVAPGRSLSVREEQNLASIQALCQQFNAAVITELAPPAQVGQTIVDVSNRLGVSQIVMGQPVQKKGWQSWWADNPVNYVLEHAEFVDLLVASNVRQEESER